MLWTIIVWIIFGLIVGLIARWLVPGAVGGGVLTDIIVGIVGAVIGGFIYRQFGHGTAEALWSWWSFIYALIGAVILLLILRAFSGRRTVV
jgi:uncharacterized membrane protein YeaQ/YmgE (transglycosylase-associated protein family)